MNVMDLIGFKGLSEEGKAEVGYGIQTCYAGKGFMTEAAKLIINWAFEEKNCLTITASKVSSSNIGSKKVLEKFGFNVVRENNK